jgi:hypothetical protein
VTPEPALAQVAQAPAPGIATDQRAGLLAQALWLRLGRRKALIVRTKLSQLAEAEDGPPPAEWQRPGLRRAPAERRGARRLSSERAAPGQHPGRGLHPGDRSP